MTRLTGHESNLHRRMMRFPILQHTSRLVHSILRLCFLSTYIIYVHDFVQKCSTCYFPPVCNLDCVHVLVRLCLCDSRISSLCNLNIKHNILKGYGQKTNVDIERCYEFQNGCGSKSVATMSMEGPACTAFV